MIPFELDTKTRLKSDGNQYHLQKRVMRTSANKDGWESIAFYLTLGSAVKGYRERHTRRGRGTLPQNLINAANALDGASSRLEAQLEKWEKVTSAD